jgi:toxin FitB
MPVLKYLADTNTVSDFFRAGNPVKQWFSEHRGQVGLSTLTLAELRRGIELRADGKARRQLERIYTRILEDYREAIFAFDEAAAMEWGRLTAEARNHPLPYEDSLIGAIARSLGLRMVTRNLRHFPGCHTVDPWTGKEYPAWKFSTIRE